jgi:hypothetical protein
MTITETIPTIAAVVAEGTTHEVYTSDASQLRDSANSVILHEIQHPADLPCGGAWMYTDLDRPDQWQDLPEWMTRRGVWLMESTIDGKLYCWMPAPRAEA